MLLKYIDMYCKSPIDALSMLRGDLMNHTAPQRRPRPSLPLAIATTLAACCAPLTAATLAPQEAQATAALFRALADPHRVRIIVLGISQPTASHHLKKLVQAGCWIASSAASGPTSPSTATACSDWPPSPTPQGGTP